MSITFPVCIVLIMCIRLTSVGIVGAVINSTWSGENCMLELMIGVEHFVAQLILPRF